MIAACTKCGDLYEFASEELANEPDRLCHECWEKTVGDLPDPPDWDLHDDEEDQAEGAPISQLVRARLRELGLE